MSAGWLIVMPVMLKQPPSYVPANPVVPPMGAQGMHSG